MNFIKINLQKIYEDKSKNLLLLEMNYIGYFNKKLNYFIHKLNLT